MARPVKYKNAEEMQSIIDDYFKSVTYVNPDTGAEYCQPTMTGLADALDMCRQSLLNYSQKDEFLDTLKRARRKVEIALERHLYGNSVTGAIFNLKNNFGWKDKQEVESTNTHKHSVTLDDLKDLSNDELERIAKGG